MKAEIISVGTELLLGNIVNTNAQYISKRLADLGVAVYYTTVVGDNHERLEESLKLAFSRCDMVITTGGLGPTTDDLTKETAAKYFKRELKLDNVSLDYIINYLNKVKRPINEQNKKQAYMPEGSIILKNNNGTAPGCIIEGENQKRIILLPGPPKEMAPMFEESVEPYLKKFSSSILYSRVLHFCGIGEAELANKISDIIENQTNPTVAPYAKETEVTLRITASAESEDEAKKLTDNMEDTIRNKVGKYIYGIDETTMETEVAKLLIKKKLTISCAESCTGGLLAGTLINYPGVSDVFMEGAVTYSNEAKMKRLCVKKETLDKFGAVSKETAIEMAEGIAKTSGTNIGVSTTGIAGPTGGTQDKKVGLVYSALYINGKTKVYEMNFAGDRQKVRMRAVVQVLNNLREELIKYNY